MSTEAKLVGELRHKSGTAVCRRMRQQGLVPGIVYGHKDAPAMVTFSAEVLVPLVKSGVKVFDLEVAGRTDKALLRDLQFDAFGDVLNHVDLMRVDPNERVTLHVPLVLKGTAPGVLGGGMLEQPLHSLTIDCLTYQIPDNVPVRIASLEIGQSILVKDLEIPDTIHVQNPPDAVVVHCVQVSTKEVLPADATGAAEPEVVGKKPADAAAADDKAPAGGGKKK
jgi:large subunit ribosomal protein L25